MTPEQLFEKNQNLVYYCMKRVSCPKAWYEDCLQEGFMELWRVCQKFDPSRGLAFATYAVPCIQGAMQRFCRENCSTIRIPRSMWEKGEVDQVIIGSLDALVDDEKSDSTTYGDFIPAEPDFYPGLFEDQIDDFWQHYLTVGTKTCARNLLMVLLTENHLSKKIWLSSINAHSHRLLGIERSFVSSSDNS